MTIFAGHGGYVVATCNLVLLPWKIISRWQTYIVKISVGYVDIRYIYIYLYVYIYIYSCCTLNDRACDQFCLTLQKPRNDIIAKRFSIMRQMCLFMFVHNILSYMPGDKTHSFDRIVVLIYIYTCIYSLSWIVCR
jgi:hypothetical protein